MMLTMNITIARNRISMVPSAGMPAAAAVCATLATLIPSCGAFHPDAGPFQPMGGFGRALAKHGKLEGVIPQIPVWVIALFAIFIVSIIAFLVYLIISDEREDARRRADEEKARSLKFGRMDPRYHRE
mmetsp:Transcript_19313/g.64747  ORF Transcript_19313/g.64747 Transcript_19313/m.64747 type:complete len:128 (+) Transcript_19313:2-385(+)